MSQFQSPDKVQKMQQGVQESSQNSTPQRSLHSDFLQPDTSAPLQLIQSQEQNQAKKNATADKINGHPQFSENKVLQAIQTDKYSTHQNLSRSAISYSEKNQFQTYSESKQLQKVGYSFQQRLDEAASETEKTTSGKSLQSQLLCSAEADALVASGGVEHMLKSGFSKFLLSQSMHQDLQQKQPQITVGELSTTSHVTVLDEHFTKEVGFMHYLSKQLKYLREKTNSKIVELGEQNLQLETQNKQLQAQNEQLEQQQVKLGNALLELNILQESQKQLTQNLQELESSNKQLQDNIQQLQQQNLELQRHNQQLNATVHHLQTQNNDLQEINKSILDEKQQLSLINSQLQNKLEESQQSLERMQVHQNEITAEINRQTVLELCEIQNQEQLQQKQEELNFMQQQLDEQRQREINLKEKSQKQIENLQKVCQELQQRNQTSGVFQNLAQDEDQSIESNGIGKQSNQMVLLLQEENTELREMQKILVKKVDELEEKVSSLSFACESKQEKIQLLQQIAKKNEEKFEEFIQNMQVFDVVQNTRNGKAFQNRAQLLIRKNNFEDTVVQIETPKTLTIFRPCDIIDLTLNKQEEASDFTITYMDHNVKITENYQAANRKAQREICRILKQQVIAATTNMGSIGSSSSKKTSKSRNLSNNVLSSSSSSTEVTSNPADPKQLLQQVSNFFNM